MRHGLFKKKDGMPKKHDPKKREKKSENKIGHIKFQEKKEEIYNNIAMSSCYPNKGERDS